MPLHLKLHQPFERILMAGMNMISPVCGKARRRREDRSRIEPAIEPGETHVRIFLRGGFEARTARR